MTSMQGKVCLITGATSGIGLETARALGRMGATLGLAARNRDKAEAVAAQIRSESQVEVTVLIADLARLDEIRRLAAEVRARYERLDVLVNNAGAIHAQREVSADALERTFAVNHLGYFLLTTELLDLLKASAPARIVSVASDAHRMGRMNWDDLQGERRYSAWQAYGQSKLANVLFTRELARRLHGTGVTANCLHPGVIASGFGVREKGIVWKLWGLASRFMLTAEKGAATSIYLASSPEVTQTSGSYFDRCRAVSPARQATLDADAARLWTVSEALVAQARTDA